MYIGFNAKRERKQTKIEKLQDEIKRLHKLLGTMIHIHERMKNERIETGEIEKLPTLPKDISGDGKPFEATYIGMPQGEGGKSTPGTDKEGD